MSISIKSAVNGHTLNITKNNQATVQAEVHSLMHHVSLTEEGAYKVADTHVYSSGDTTILHLCNDSSTENMVVTDITLQVITSDTVPAVGEYFTAGFGQTIASGGSAVTPVNLNRKSGKSAVATITGNNPTVTGTFVEFDRSYFQPNGDTITWEEQNAIILGKDDTMSIRTTSSGAGTAHATITFMMTTR